MCLWALLNFVLFSENFENQICVFVVQLEQSQLQKDVLKLNTYVALHSFTAQDSHDLEMRLVYTRRSNQEIPLKHSLSFISTAAVRGLVMKYSWLIDSDINKYHQGEMCQYLFSNKL